MKIFKARRDIENLHIFLWLMKDNAWCHDWHFVGMAMLIPTFAVQGYLTWKNQDDVHELFHSIAVLLWIMANGVWMIGEFYYDDTWRLVPEIFFGGGLASILFYYAVYFRSRDPGTAL